MYDKKSYLAHLNTSLSLAGSHGHADMLKLECVIRSAY